MQSGVFLGHLLGADRGPVLIVTQGVAHATISGWTRTRVEIQYVEGGDRDQITALITETDRLRTIRNTLIHGQWMVRPFEGSAIVQTAKLERGEIAHSDLYTLADLQAVHEELCAVLNQWNLLVDAVGL
jgi:hypothetical protein